MALVGQHVGIEERRLRLPIPDRQVGHAAILRPQARERDLHPVDAGLIVGVPPRRPAGNRMPRPDQVSHLVRHADRRRLFGHLLAPLRRCCRSPDVQPAGPIDPGFHRLFRIGPGEHRVGRGEIPLDVRRRERKHRTDPVESAKDRVLVEHARLGDLEPHAEQVGDRVGIFLPAQAVVGHRTAGGHAGRLARGQLARDPLDHARDLVGGRPRLLLGGHLPGVDPRHHLGPPLGCQLAREGAVERVEAKLPLLHLAVVATDAVLLEKRVGHAAGRPAGRGGVTRARCQGRHGQTDEPQPDEPRRQRSTSNGMAIGLSHILYGIGRRPRNTRRENASQHDVPGRGCSGHGGTSAQPVSSVNSRVESLNDPVSIPIFWDIVSSRLLNRAFGSTGLKQGPIRSFS